MVDVHTEFSCLQPAGAPIIVPAPAPGSIFVTAPAPLQTLVLPADAPAAVLGPAPGVPDYLTGATEVAPGLFYEAQGPAAGFYYVNETAAGANVSQAYNTLPIGSAYNASLYSTVGLGLLLTGPNVYPFEPINEAALLTTLNNAIAAYPHQLILEALGVRSADFHSASFKSLVLPLGILLRKV